MASAMPTTVSPMMKAPARRGVMSEVRGHVGGRRLGAQELGDVPLGRPPREVLEGAFLHDAAVVEQRDRRPEQERLAHVVGDEQHGLSELTEDRDEMRLQLGARDRIERTERLIEQQDRRVEHPRARQAYALARATAQPRGVEIAQGGSESPELGPAAEARSPARRTPRLG